MNSRLGLFLSSAICAGLIAYIVGGTLLSWGFWAFVLVVTTIVLAINGGHRQRIAGKGVEAAIQDLGQGHSKAIAEKVKERTGIMPSPNTLFVELKRLEDAGRIEGEFAMKRIGFPRVRLYRIAARPKVSTVVTGRFGRKL